MRSTRTFTPLLAAGTLAALALAAPAAPAQQVRPVSFGVAGGVSQPLGDFGDGVNTGWNVMGTLGVQPPAQAFGFRVDAMYHRFGLDEEPFRSELPPGTDFDFDGNGNIIAGVASIVMTVSNAGGVRPYLIGGGGVYRLAQDIEGTAGGERFEFDDSRTEFGLAGGGGIAFPLGGFSAFVEARFHSVFAGDDDDEDDTGNVNFIPVVFGLQF